MLELLSIMMWWSWAVIKDYISPCISLNCVAWLSYYCGIRIYIFNGLWEVCLAVAYHEFSSLISNQPFSSLLAESYWISPTGHLSKVFSLSSLSFCMYPLPLFDQHWPTRLTEWFIFWCHLKFQYDCWRPFRETKEVTSSWCVPKYPHGEYWLCVT